MKKYNVTVNGTTYEVIVEEVSAGATTTPTYTPPKASAPAPAPQKKEETASGNKVCAPMPGTILDIKVKPGQSVKKGDVICVLEAMKMENDIPSPCDGVIGSVLVKKGSTVAANDVIASIN